jgi:hypothetical protein
MAQRWSYLVTLDLAAPRRVVTVKLQSGKLDEWMTTALQIATGSRRQVPEDGPDVMNSESDSDNEQHGDEIQDG